MHRKTSFTEEIVSVFKRKKKVDDRQWSNVGKITEKKEEGKWAIKKD